MNKKDILFIGSYPYEKCGVSTYTSNIIEELIKYKDLDYIEISFRNKPLKSFFLYLTLIHKSFYYKNLHFQYTPLIGGPFIGIIIYLIKKINNNSYILITSHEKPSVYLKYLPKFLHIFFKIYERIIYKYSDNIIVLSHEFKAIINEYYGIETKKINVLQHGVYIRKPNMKTDNSDVKFGFNSSEYNYIGFLGFIRKNKGLDVLIKYFNNLKFNNVKLFIGGSFSDNEYKKIILELINKNKENIILYENFIDESDFGRILSCLKILVLPYDNITQSGILNYGISYNVPLLLRDTGGIAEINNQYKIASIFLNEDTFHSELFKLINNEDYINYIKDNQINYYNEYNFESIVKRDLLVNYK